jgi:O-antigen/teichoic acid export membrane protein
VLSFVGSWCALLLDNGTAYLRLRYFSKLFIIVVVSQLVIALASNIYFVVWEGIGIRGILYSSVISSLCVALPIAVWILRVSKARFSAKVFVAFVKFGVPLLPSQLGLSLGYLSNRFFLQRYASLTEVGLFSFGYSVGVLVSRFVSTPLNSFWAPRKLELLLGHTEEARNVVARMCTYSTMLIIFVTLLLSLTARDIVMVIAGSQYFRAHEIIPVIGLAIAIGSLENHVNAGILLEKRTALLSLCGGISLAVVLASNYMLVPLMGMMGAAIATLVGTALRVFLILGTSQRIHPLPFEIVQLLKGFCVAFFIYGFGTLFVLHENPGVEFGLRVLTGCTFPLGLIALKCVGGAEIAIVRNVLRGPTMVAVASQEKVP